MEGVYVKTEPEPIPHASTSEPPVPLAVPLEAQPCRLCANIPDRAIEIYSTEGLSNQLSDRINEYLPVKVSPDDKLPLCCCWTCVTTLLSFHELVVACVEAEKRLQIIEPPKPILVPALPDPEPDIVEFNDDDAEMMDADDGEGDIDGDDDYEPENEDDDEESEEETKPIPGTSDDTESIDAEDPLSIKQHQTSSNDGSTSGELFDMEKVIQQCRLKFNDGRMYYKCDMCRKYFQNISGLSTHYPVHFNRKRNRFSRNYLSERSAQIKERCKTTNPHGRIVYKCDSCEEAFTNGKLMVAHYAKHLPPSEQRGGISFKMRAKVPPQKAQEIMERGRCLEDGVEVLKCHLCTKVYKCTSKAFVTHVYMHDTSAEELERLRQIELIKERCLFITPDGRKVYRCDICNFTKDRSGKLLDHYATHDKAPVKKTKLVCNWSTGEKVSNQRRKRTFTDLEKVIKTCEVRSGDGSVYYQCFVCGMKVDQKNYFEEHYVTAHCKSHKNTSSHNYVRRNASIKERCKSTDLRGKTVYKCDRCEEVYSNAELLVLHYVVHLNPNRMTGVKKKKKQSKSADLDDAATQM